MVAIRPDDLRPTDDGPIAALVEIAEYHGRDFYAVARGTEGEEPSPVLPLRSLRIAAGETVRLSAARERVPGRIPRDRVLRICRCGAGCASAGWMA